LTSTIIGVTPSLAQDLFVGLAAACADTRRCFDRYVGMSQAQRQLLTLLKEHGELRHASLQQRLGVDGATVTRLVKRLEVDGTVVRRLDPADNRYTLASLTSAGEELVVSLGAAHRRFQNRLLAGIDWVDQETVVQVLEQVRANVRAVDEGGGST
jgi:DNA-binding MarR family transcriptional regulator